MSNEKHQVTAAAKANGWTIIKHTANLFALTRGETRINIRFYTNKVNQITVPVADTKTAAILGGFDLGGIDLALETINMAVTTS